MVQENRVTVYMCVCEPLQLGALADPRARVNVPSHTPGRPAGQGRQGILKWGRACLPGATRLVGCCSPRADASRPFVARSERVP